MNGRQSLNDAVQERYPLTPYRVLDLTDDSGVFCTKLLAGLGADVIKVEPPEGDPTRRIGPFYHDEVHPEKSLHWFTYNLNKRAITLNIRSSTGQGLFRRLVKTADFLVECFRPGYLDTLGLDYAELSALNPRIIHTSITPWGSTGPYSQFKGSNLIDSASSGYMYLCGDGDRPPVQVSAPAAYLHAGVNAAAATMVAHWWRRRTGEGQYVDVSAQESLMSQVLPRTLLWKSQRLIPHRGREGAIIPGRATYLDMFECKDGLLIASTTIVVGRRPVREWLASEGMAGDLFEKEWDPVFLQGVAVSAEQKEHIDELFRAFAIKHTREELMYEAQKRGVQAVKVQSVRDVMEDPHLKEKQYFVNVEHPELRDTITYAGAPFKSNEMSMNYWRRAPFIGEDNQSIYGGELGLSGQELAVLKEGGII